MSRLDSTRLLVLLTVTCVLLAAVAGVSMTWSDFFDSESGGGTIQAAEDFGYLGDGACIDTDQNWECNGDDIPVPRSELNTFSNESARLVIPEAVGPVVNDTVDITAKGFKTEVDIESRYGNSITISTENERLQVVESTIATASGSLTLDSASGEIRIDDSTVTSDTGSVELTTNGGVTARGATIDTRSSLTMSGEAIDLTDAALDGDYGSMSVTASNTLTLDSSQTVTSSGQVTFRGASISATSTTDPTRIETSSGVSLLATNGAGNDLDAANMEIISDSTVELKADEKITVDGGTLTTGSGDPLTIDAETSVSAIDSTLSTGGSLDVLAGESLDVDRAKFTADAGIIVRGRSVSLVEAEMTSDGSLTIGATNKNGGRVVATGAELSTSYGSMRVEANEQVTIDGAHIESSNGGITVLGRSISAKPNTGDNAVITTDAEIRVLATKRNGGDVDATQVEIVGDYGDIELESKGDLTVENATIRSNSNARARLNRPSSTLYYNGLVIEDSDDTLIYSPRQVEERGQTKSGSVEPN